MLLLALLGLGTAGLVVATRGGPERRSIRLDRRSVRRRRPERRQALASRAQMLRDRHDRRVGRRNDRRNDRREVHLERMGSVDLFGRDDDYTQANYVVDPRTGALVRPGLPADPDNDPVRAGRDFTVSMEQQGFTVRRPFRWPVDDAVQIVVPGVDRASWLGDRAAAHWAAQHGISVIRVTDPTMALTSFIFTTSPRTVWGLAQVAGQRPKWLD